MKILFICQYYTPEPFHHPDFCEELVKRGHEVSVVTGVPNYPMGEIYEGYRHGERRSETINGVKVHRCFTVGRKTGAFNRFVNYYSYAISSARYVKRLKEKYDVVLVNQLSPVMMAKAGIEYKKKHGTKLVLYCLDLWPESLCVGGIKRNSLIYKYFHGLSKKIYKQADRILVSSRSFSDYFETEFGITDTEYLPQYAEALFTPEQCRKEPDEYLDFMFAGNLGTAQSLCTIIETARQTNDIKNIRWHIVGDGSEYETLKKQAAGLENVFFYGRKPIEDMPKYYSMADAMLVTMKKDPIISLTLPSKVQSYMAAGKPIIGVIDGETEKTISASRCGVCCESENVTELAMLIRSFDRKKLKEYAANSRAFYLEHFSKSIFVDAMERSLASQ